MAKKINTVAAVRELAAPVASGMGLELWDVEFQKEGPDWVLRLYIDKPGGVFIDDCEELSRALDPLLDELDPTDKEYLFEVSSPGMGRALRTDAHLSAYLEKPVKARLIRPDQAGERDFSGLLKGFTADELTLETPGGEKTLARAATAFLKADDDETFFGGLK